MYLGIASAHGAIDDVAADMSPRVEVLAPGLVTADVSGLRRMFRDAHAVARAAGRLAAARGLPEVSVAVAGTWVAAALLARAHPGAIVVPDGDDAGRLADLPVTHLAGIGVVTASSCAGIFDTLRRWGIETCADLARLPAGALHARLGRAGLALQALARGADPRPLVATRPAEIFEETCELEWPIEAIEPLSFVLARLLDPLCQRLERRDRGVAVLRLRLQLVTRAGHARALELPAPMRDPKTLRTLLLLDLESHPPDAGIDRVTVAAEVVPGRIVHETLFEPPPRTPRAPVPERLAILTARLKALAGESRVGSPRLVDSHRPDAFTMAAFAPDQPESPPPPLLFAPPVRRLRRPWPIRVRAIDGHPAHLWLGTGELGGGVVGEASGPWRTSGEWWTIPDLRPPARAWNRDEWDVTTADGAAYRIFCDRTTGAWYLEGELD